MNRRLSMLLFACSCLAAAQAQDFKVFDREVQVHGFATQGYVYTNQNNWLTMRTSENGGSFAMTDFGLNISMPITDKFRIGAQVYDRNLGQLGQWHPSLDWAYAQYKFRPWLGVRGGKVKTVFGLFNDTQDVDSARVFSLLPQSIYPTDLRDATIAHVGGDVFGDVPLGKKLGSLSYTAFAGLRNDGKYGGFPYLSRTEGVFFTSYGGPQFGIDLRWNTPVTGLVVGAARLNQDITGKGTISLLVPVPMPYKSTTKANWTNQFYGQYSWKKLELDSEYRRNWQHIPFSIGPFPAGAYTTDVHGWYVGGSYALFKRLQLGSYYSRYENVSAAPLSSVFQSGHEYDKVISAKIDLNKYTYIKVEGHFTDGFGATTFYPNGFYTAVNPLGLKPATKALVIKGGFSF